MRAITIILLSVFLNTCYGQPGETDLSFNPIDSGYSKGEGFHYANVYSTALQNDGKILVAGSFQGTTYNGSVIASNIIRLNSDGSIDNSFSNSSAPNNNVQKVDYLPNGKIIIAGAFTTFGNHNCGRIVRLNSDGTLDLTFNSSGVNAQILELVIQNDGKIMIGGNFTTSTCSKILRLNDDGTIDSTFNAGLNTNKPVKSIEIDESGNYYVGGEFTIFNGVSKSKIVKLLNDGSIDNSFDIGSGIFNGNVFDLMVNRENAIIVIGSFSAYNGQSANNIIALNPNGTKNTGFNSPFPSASLRYLNSIIQLDDGYYVFGGFYSSPAAPFLYKTLENGEFDLSFEASAALSSEGGVFTIKKTINEDLIIGGSFRQFRKWIGSGIVKINISGQKYMNFNPNGGINGAYISVRAIERDNDGKYLIAGNLLQYNDVSCRGLLRVDANGVPDSSFDIGNGVGYITPNSIEAIGIQADNKIVAGGIFSQFNSVTKNNIVRLKANGSIDSSFITATGLNLENNGFDGSVSTIFIQADDKILIGGSFTKYRGIACKKIIRLLANGDIDNSFIYGSGFNYPVSKILELSDGRIMVGGSFSTYNGNNCNNLVILTQNGSVDLSFNSGQGLSGAYSIDDFIELSTSKFLVAIGSLDTWNNQNLDGLIRLNPDGSVDGSYDLSEKFDRSVTDVILLSENKILVSGFFTKKGNHNCKGLVRLDSNGQIDLSFSTGTGVGFDPGGFSRIKMIQTIGQDYVIVGGNFISYNGIGKNRLTKIRISDVNLPIKLLSFSGKKGINSNQLSWSTTSEINFRRYEIERSTNGRDFTKIGHINSNELKEVIKYYSFIDDNPKEGVNYYRIKILDKDNSYAYSNIVSILNVGQTEFLLSPNPVSDYISIPEDALLSKFTLLNANGQFIKGGKIETYKLNVSDLPGGFYFLIIESKDINSRYRFVKM